MDFQNNFKTVIIDLDDYSFKRCDDPINIIITRSKTDDLVIDSEFLSHVKFCDMKIDNVKNVIGICDYFMEGAECVNDNKICLNFPDVKNIGKHFCDNLIFNNKITFKFPEIESVGKYFMRNLNRQQYTPNSIMSVKIPESTEMEFGFCERARLNKFIIPFKVEAKYNFHDHDIKQIVIKQILIK